MIQSNNDRHSQSFVSLNDQRALAKSQVIYDPLGGMQRDVLHHILIALVS